MRGRVGRNNHWCVVSTVGCENVNVYDSLYSSVSSIVLPSKDVRIDIL